MPRDIPYRDTMESEPIESCSRLRSVEATASVWATAVREYRVGKIDQLPMRARLLDVLEQLQRGHLLALMGTTLPVVWLDGRHDIALLAGVLFCYGYVEIVGRHRDNASIVYFGLSSKGELKLRDGRAWWSTLSLRQRLWVRLFG
jgi:hypothetical protein